MILPQLLLWSFILQLSPMPLKPFIAPQMWPASSPTGGLLLFWGPFTFLGSKALPSDITWLTLPLPLSPSPNVTLFWGCPWPKDLTQQIPSLTLHPIIQSYFFFFNNIYHHLTYYHILYIISPPIISSVNSKAVSILCIPYISHI